MPPLSLSFVITSGSSHSRGEDRDALQPIGNNRRFSVRLVLVLVLKRGFLSAEGKEERRLCCDFRKRETESQSSCTRQGFELRRQGGISHSLWSLSVGLSARIRAESLSTSTNHFGSTFLR
jgi:hypothetical protein